MAYTVDKTNSSASPSSYTVQDGVLNTQTDLKFIGKGYAGYGEVIHENFLHLLENFANNSAPSKPIQGQLWYDSGASQLKVYTGSNFVPAGNTVPYGPTAPANLVTGDLWIDSDTAQLFFYNGTSNILIGPNTSAGANTNGFTFETITDNTDTDQNVTKLFNNGNLIAIISEDEFTPKAAISGFGTIKKGITLSTAISDLKFAGTSTDTDALGGVAAANYLRSNANDTTSGTLGINNDDGVKIGVDNDLTLTVDSSGVVVQNIISDRDITFKVNTGGTTTTLMTMDGSAARIGIGTLTPTTKLDVSGTINATAFTGPITGNVVGAVTGDVTGDVTGTVTGSASLNLLLTGGTLTGTLNSQAILPSADSTYNLGTDGTRFATAFFDTLDATEIKSQGVTVNDNEIVASRSNDDLVLKGAGTGAVVLDGLQVTGTSLSATDSSAVTVNDDLQVQGNFTADSIIGEVISVGTISAGVTTNQTIDATSGRFFEIFINGDVTLNFTGAQNGTLKRIIIVTQTADIRQVTFQIDGVTQGSRPVGDGSTTNAKELLELHSYETQKALVRYILV
tara:strand:- start:1557 stop:3254 length:1698 start_codon:yes stop_codon:yes gene_type:complete